MFHLVWLCLMIAMINGQGVTNSPPEWHLGSCTQSTLFCHKLALCHSQVNDNNQSVFQCFCPNGTTGDGYQNGTGCSYGYISCTDDNDCDQYGFCNLQNLPWKCQCRSGFVETASNTCQDIDECLTVHCDVNAFCLNELGTFRCACDSSANYFGDGYTCHHECRANNDCPLYSECDIENKTCTCMTGFEGDGHNCTDIDECASVGACDLTVSSCVNTIGSYVCDCNDGFVKENEICKALPRTCDEIRQSNPTAKSGTYVIDPDFRGPARKLEVNCEFRPGYAITSVPLTVTGDQDAVGDTILNYRADVTTLKALISASHFCSQFVGLNCLSSATFTDGFSWSDPNGVSHSTWGGASKEGMCACGQVQKCDRCHCGHGSAATDEGTFVNKTQLPVMKVTFPNRRQGSFQVHPLRCGPQTFDMYRDCDDSKRKGITTNGPQLIDPDGPFGNAPFLVYCDVETYSHVGVTEMQLIVNNIVPDMSFPITLEYVQSINNIEYVIGASAFCTQHASYRCQNSKISDGKTYVTVTSHQRRLNYFPGANGEEKMCGCGVTKSCENTSLSCNCDLTDGEWRRDFGAIINKTDLPIVGVAADVGAGKSGIFDVSDIKCAPFQFGIEPNCEKLRMQDGFEPVRHTYFIDPDGPKENALKGQLDPFLVECIFSDSPAQAITVVHHLNEITFNIESQFIFNYGHVSLDQLGSLKIRSTYCSQELIVACRKIALGWNFADGTWTDFSGNETDFSQTLAQCNTSSGCLCDDVALNRRDSDVITDKNQLPMRAINFQSLSSVLNTMGPVAEITIGPLKCSETFPNCSQLSVSPNRVTGEASPDDGYFTIDPDGSGSIEAFEVQCSFPTTIIFTNTTTGGISIGSNNTEPISQCFDVIYKDQNGRLISPNQLISLRDNSVNCYQELWVTCQYARVHGHVNYTTCDGRTQVGWAGSAGVDACACGVGGYCAGGPEAKCNCDLEDDTRRTDGATIIRKDGLPVCQVCLSLDGIPSESLDSVPFRRLEYRVSSLYCHPGNANGIQGSCQEVRSRRGDNLQTEEIEVVFMNPESPVPVGCRLLPRPPIGLLELFPKQNIFNITQSTVVNITVEYYVINITVINDMMQNHVYCSQRLYFFCLAENQNISLGGGSGWISVHGNMETDWIKLSNDDIPDTICTDYPEECQQCGKPHGYIIVEKNKLPVTGLTLFVERPVTVVLDNVKCADVAQSCSEIVDSTLKPYTTSDIYVIDPDGPIGVPPFKVSCELKPNDEICGVTKVQVEDRFVTGVTANAPNNVTVGYVHASKEQIEKLIQVSPTCWQAVDFQCQDTTLINGGNQPNSYYMFGNEQSLTFGMDNSSDTSFGCMCNLTGTCGNGLACHCDAGKGLSGDWGLEGRKDKLPITSVIIGGQKAIGAHGTFKTGDVVCTDCVERKYPKNCQEALSWRTRYGLQYTRSGEYFINPNPGVIDPFPVYCEMNTSTNVGITIVKPKDPNNTSLSLGVQSHFEYYGLTHVQLVTLVMESEYCFQPVKYICYQTKLLGGGVVWSGPIGTSPNKVWGGGSASRNSCACGETRTCGGLDSAEGQRQRKCNCDVFDERWRADAGILVNKEQLPLTSLSFESQSFGSNSIATIILGDLYCRQDKIEFNECSTGFHDCDERADCTDTAEGYTCQCQNGWKGKTLTPSASDPVANGRECIDDDECTFPETCPFPLNCTNTPGSYFCTCRDGYRQTGPKSCVDIDECAEGTHNCDEKATCTNQQGSFKCTCQRAYRGSGIAGDCHNVATCTIFGDPHLQSFDGQFLHYQGRSECLYVAAQDGCNVTTPSFRVLFKPWTQGSSSQGHGYVSWVEWVEVRIHGKVIRMLQNRGMIVDGVLSQGFSAPGIRLVNNGRQNILKTDLGIDVYWDGDTQLDIILPASYTKLVCGHCGNFNHNPQDDWTVGPVCNDSAGSVTDNYQVFGESWVDMDYLSKNPQCTPDCNSPPPGPECFLQKEIVYEYCDRIFKIGRSPFSECIESLSSGKRSGMYESCVFDLCHVWDVMDTVCYHAKSLALECQLNLNQPIQTWRTSEFCPMKCAANMTYMTCGPDPNNPSKREGTCLDKLSFSVNDTSAGCMEGCFCLPGYIRDADRCVLPTDCGCTYNGTYISVGTTFTEKGCTRSVTCQAGGHVQETDLQCGEHAECGLKDGVIGCYCNVGYISDGVDCILDICNNVTCPNNTKCERGVCECTEGYIGDCKHCEDIDECGSRIDDCDAEGQICINTNGSYICGCEYGYVNLGEACEDVDECALGIDQCPDHSQCINIPGFYQCSCCVGYTFNSIGACVVNSLERTMYTSGNAACCSCTTPQCNQPGQVCGTDGQTYVNIRSLVVNSCLAGTRVEPMYTGQCSNTCQGVACSRPFSECEVVDRVAYCTCPSCYSSIDVTFTQSVCASDLRIYKSECDFRSMMCAQSITTIHIVQDMSVCLGQGGGGWIQITGWSNCSSQCGEGVTTATFKQTSLPLAEYNISAVCYKFCGGEVHRQCQDYTCSGPGEVCLDTHEGAKCVCPQCEYVVGEPVCGAVGDDVSTFDNECELKRMACIKQVDFVVLDNKTCDALPVTCRVTQNFYRGVDEDGCSNPDVIDYGKCAGGCGRLPEECCFKSNATLTTVPFQCSDGSVTMREVEVISACGCIPPGEVKRRKDEEEGKRSKTD